MPDKKEAKKDNPSKENAMAERRKYMRFQTSMDVEYKTLTLNPIFGKTLAKDLSREGIRVGLKQNVPVGTTLEICLNVPGDNLPVFATGKVAWADGLDVGVKLMKINQQDRAKILEYVYREWLTSSRKASEGE